MRVLILGCLGLCGAEAGAVARPPDADLSPESPAVLVFRPADFGDIGAVNALDLVRRIPGFTIQGGEQVRGYAGAGGNVLIDGTRPATRTGSLSDSLRAVPVPEIERLELIRSGAGVAGQDAAGPVVNVVRKSADLRTGARTLSAYAYPDGIVRPSLRLEGTRRRGGRNWQASILLSANQDESGTGPRTRRAADGEVIEQARIAIDAPIEGLDGRLSGDMPLQGGTLRGSLYVLVQDYRIRERLWFAAGGERARAEIADRILTSSGEALVEWEGPISGSDLKLLATATRKRQLLRSASTDGGIELGFDGRSITDEAIARAVLGRSAGPALVVEAAAEAAFTRLDSRSDLRVDGEPVRLPASDVRVEEWRFDFLSRATATLATGLTVEAALGAEVARLAQLDRGTGRRSARRDVFGTPRLLVSWSPDAAHQLRFRLEREVGQLDFADFASAASLVDATVDAGNIDLRPPVTRVVEAALERRFPAGGAVVLTLARERIEDLVDTILVDEVNAPGNIGRGIIDRLGTTLTVPLEGLGLSGGNVRFDGTWRQSRVRDPLTDTMRPINNVAPFSGEARATLDRPRLRSTFSLDLFVGQTLEQRRIAEQRRTRDQPYVTVGWTWRPRPALTSELSLTNILARRRDRERTVFEGLRNEGRVAFTEARSFRSRPGLFWSLRWESR